MHATPKGRKQTFDGDWLSTTTCYIPNSTEVCVSKIKLDRVLSFSTVTLSQSHWRDNQVVLFAVTFANDQAMTVQGQCAIPLTRLDQAGLVGKGTIFPWCYDNIGNRQTDFNLSRSKRLQLDISISTSLDDISQVTIPNYLTPPKSALLVSKAQMENIAPGKGSYWQVGSGLKF